MLAQEEARDLNHNFLGTEHILLGLLHEGEGVGAKALEGLGFKLDDVRAKVLETIGAGDAVPSEAPPFTPRAKKVLELSLREALKLGHNYIGTEHLLLGLIREGEGVASQVLVLGGAHLEEVRQRVMDLLIGYTQPFGSSGVGVQLPGVPRMTAGAARLVGKARSAAIGKLVGSHHFLLGMLQVEDSMAAKVLTSLGVTTEALQTRIDQLSVVGTSDESDADRDVEVAPGVTVRFASS